MLATATKMERVQDDTTQALDPSDARTALFEYTVPREKAKMALMDRKKRDTTSCVVLPEMRSPTQYDRYLDVISDDYKQHFTQDITGVLDTAEQSGCYSADALGLEPKMVAWHKHRSIGDWTWGSEELKELILRREGMITRLVNLPVSSRLPKTFFSSVVSHALRSIFNSCHQLGENKFQVSLLAKMEENRLRSSLLAQLREWRQTPEDYGPDAHWPADQAFEEAEAFISKLPLSAFPLLDMGVAEDGEINFLWENDDIEIDLGFYGTRPCTYFARDKRDGRKIPGSDFDPSDGLPDQLEALLTS